MLPYTEDNNYEDSADPIEITCPACLKSETFTKCLKHQREDTRYNNTPNITEYMEKAGVPKRFLAARITDFPKLTKKFHLDKCLIPELDGVYKGKSRSPVLTTVHVYDFPSSPKGLLLEGPVGTGKTHLLCAILAEVILDGGNAMFIRSTQFLSDIKKSFGKQDLSNIDTKTEDLIELVKNVDFLFIDDLGVTKETDWAYSVWFDLIDARCAECRYTSVSLNDADVFDSRIKRRLLEMCEYVELTI